MPQYRNPSFESAARLNALASATFNQGTAARDTAERYVRDTVLFASVLFLVAIAQRFKVRSVRIATTTVAFGLAAYTTVAVADPAADLSRPARPSFSPDRGPDACCHAERGVVTGGYQPVNPSPRCFSYADRRRHRARSAELLEPGYDLGIQAEIVAAVVADQLKRAVWSLLPAGSAHSGLPDVAGRPPGRGRVPRHGGRRRTAVRDPLTGWPTAVLFRTSMSMSALLTQAQGEFRDCQGLEQRRFPFLSAATFW